MVRTLIAIGLLAGCTTTGATDTGASVEDASFDAPVRFDAPAPDVPIRDVGPLPDGFEWARCEDFVDAGAPGGGGRCDPATFGSCNDPRAMGCAASYVCDEATRVIMSPLIC